MISNSKEIKLSEERNRTYIQIVIATIIIVGGLFAKGQFDWIVKYPRKWVIPLKNWITDFFRMDCLRGKILRRH